jgi:hypothetical protein
MTVATARRPVLGVAALGLGVLALYFVVKQAGTAQTLSLLWRALPLLSSRAWW